MIKKKFRDDVGRELFNYPPGSHLICILGESPEDDGIGLDWYIHDCKIQEHSHFSSCLYKTGLHFESIRSFFETTIKDQIVRSACVVPSLSDEGTKGIKTAYVHGFWKTVEGEFDRMFSGIVADVSNAMTHQS